MNKASNRELVEIYGGFTNVAELRQEMAGTEVDGMTDAQLQAMVNDNAQQALRQQEVNINKQRELQNQLNAERNKPARNVYVDRYVPTTTTTIYKDYLDSPYVYPTTRLGYYEKEYIAKKAAEEAVKELKNRPKRVIKVIKVVKSPRKKAKSPRKRSKSPKKKK